MTELPTVAVSQVCQTPSSANKRWTPSMSQTRVPRILKFGTSPSGNSPSSKARYVSSGGMTDSAALTSTSTTVTIRVGRCGANRAQRRHSRWEMRGASVFAARYATASALLTRVRFMPAFCRGPTSPAQPRSAQVHASFAMTAAWSVGQTLSRCSPITPASPSTERYPS